MKTNAELTFSAKDGYGLREFGLQNLWMAE
jgi:hypothetical protein